MVVSAGLISCGLWYLASSAEGAREQLEEEYQKSIQKWTVESRREFRHLDITVSTRYHSVPLQKDTTTDLLHDSENGVALPQYEALSYHVRGVPREFLPAADFSSLQEHHVDSRNHGDDSLRPSWSKGKHSIGQQEWGPVVSFAMKLEDDSFGSSHLETGSYPLLRAIAKHAPTPAPELKCQRELQGRFLHGLCWVYSRLVGICVQVRKDPISNKWHLSRAVPALNESYGCDYSLGGWTAFHYERVPASQAAGFVSFENLSIQVRSAEDPFLQAMNLTSGVLDFGMTAQDDRAVGFVVLILGLLVACPPCFRLCQSYRKERDGDHDSRELRPVQWHRHHEEEEMSGIGGGYQGWESDPHEMHARS